MFNVNQTLRTLSRREKRLRRKWVTTFSVISTSLLVVVYFTYQSSSQKLERDLRLVKAQRDSIKNVSDELSARLILSQEKISQYEFTFDYLKVLDPEIHTKVQDYLNQTKN